MRALGTQGYIHVGGCQNYRPLLGSLNIRCRIILRTQKGTIILTTSHVHMNMRYLHVRSSLCVLSIYPSIYLSIYLPIHLHISLPHYIYIYIYTLCIFKSLRLRPPTPEAYGKTADFGTLCIPGSSQRRDPSAALLSSSDRSRLAALNVMLTPCPVP